MIPDHINHPLRTETDIISDQIADMAESVKLTLDLRASYGILPGGTMLKVVFRTPGGKIERFNLHYNRQVSELLEILGSLFPEEKDKISGEVVELVLEKWYTRINNEEG